MYRPAPRLLMLVFLTRALPLWQYTDNTKDIKPSARYSGRFDANTRCSVCRFDAGGLHVQLSPAPGRGLQSPETGSQNRRYRDLSWRQRPHMPHLNPPKCPQIAGYSSETGKHRFASDCVVVPRGLKLRARHAVLSNLSL
jgi:hypothetical protein